VSFVLRSFLESVAVPAVLLCCALLPAEVFPSENHILSADFTHDTLSIEMTVGFDGCYKCGFLTPAEVCLSSGDWAGGLEGSTLRVVLESEDPDTTPTRWEKEVFFRPNELCRVDFLFMSGREGTPLTVSVFSSEGGELARRVFKPEGTARALRSTGELSASPFPKPIGTQRPIWLIVGGDASAPTRMLNSLQLPSERVPVPVPIERLTDLPRESDGLDAADLVVLNTSDPRAYDDARQTAEVLNQWTMRGGKTILFGSPETVDLLAPGQPLADFVPGTIRASRPAELRAAPSLVRFVPKAKNLVMLGSLDSPYLKFPFLESIAPGARVELHEEGTPLLVREPVGFGTHTFFAPDIGAAPLTDWVGHNGLLMKIFEPEVERLTTQSEQTGLIRLGYRDLAGQLRSALDRFESVHPFPFSAVFALMAFFVAVVGPLDWFFTHRLFKRPNLTWFTLPAWLFLFAGLAVWLGGQFHTKEFRVNIAEMVDMDAETGLVRGSLWGGIYAPQDARLDMTAGTAASAFSDTQTRLTWLGLTGDGLGGISSPIRSLGTPSEGYLLDGGSIYRFPVPIRSTRSVSARWFSRREPLAARLTDRNGKLFGSLVNPFDEQLSGVILLYGGHAWVLGSLPPGESRFDSSVPRTDEVQRILLGAISPFDGRLGNVEGRTAWERFSDTSTDVLPILRVSGFYRLAGGRLALGLGNEGMARLDGSDALEAGRAILLAAEPKSRSRLEIDFPGEQAASPKFLGGALRIWIPVELADPTDGNSAVE
jgi:hypothetical protein